MIWALVARVFKMADPSDLEKFMQNEDSQSNQHLSRIVRDIYDSKTSMLQIVEDLESYLTSVNISRRCRAVQLLSGILQRLVNFKLNQQQVEVLCNFYCDRLRDHYSIAPHSLIGIQALIVNQEIPGQLVVKTVQALFAEINNQSLMQSGRYTVYGILLAAITKYLKDLQTIGSDFVFGFIQTMDGEKDPRNLVLSFQLVALIVKHFPIGLFAEDLFEVTSCYFPIDFNPSSEDPSGITKDDLVLGLRKCLSSTNLFASFCLPLLHEKLTSDVISAKVDSLLTLASCMEVYTTQSIKDYLDPFWKSIQREVYQTVSSDLEDAALLSLTSMVKNVCSQKQDIETRDNFLSVIIKECQQHLSSDDLRMMKPNGRILQATATASELAYQQVASSTIPLLLDKYNAQPQGVARKITLDVLLEMLKVSRDFHSTVRDPVAVNKETVHAIMFEALASESPSMNCAGITGLVAMVSLSDVYSHDQVKLFIQHLTKHALNTSDAAVRQESTMALAYLSSKFPALIKTEVLPVVRNHVSSEESVSMVCDSSAVTTETNNHGYTVDTLCVVCTEESLVRDVIATILTHSKNLANINEITDDIKIKGKKTFTSLLSVVEGTLKCNLITPEYYSNNLIPEVLSTVLEPALQEAKTNLMVEADILETISSVLRVITSQLQPESIEKTLQSTIALFLEGILPESLNQYKDTVFKPLEVTSPWQQTQLVLLLMSVICSVKKEVSIPKYQVLVSKLECLACQSTHKRTNIAAAKCLAGLINKMDHGQNLDNLLQHLKDTVWPRVTDGTYKEHHWSLLIMWLWITRALIIRSHPASTEFIKKIMSMFDVEDLGKVASDGFYILIMDSDDIMTTTMHANIRIMYRQRFFMETLPLLLAGFQSSPTVHKHNYLTALSHLLRWIPKQVLMSEIPNLMPLLIQSLSNDQASLLLSSLQTLYSLVFDAPEAITRQVTSIIPNLLQLVKFKASMTVRIEALKCLGAMTTLPHHVVYVYKSKVIKSLAPSLDDRKRLVRTAAVTCRNEWFLLGST